MGAVVACPACGTKNRVPVTGKPVCGSCRSDLPWVVEATDATFDAAVATPTPVVVDLWAPWCGPCRVIGPALEDLARQRAGRLKVVKVDVDACPQVAGRYAVQSIPTLLLLDRGEVVDRQIGAVPAPALAQWVDRHLV